MQHHYYHGPASPPPSHHAWSLTRPTSAPMDIHTPAGTDTEMLPSYERFRHYHTTLGALGEALLLPSYLKYPKSLLVETQTWPYRLPLYFCRRTTMLHFLSPLMHTSYHVHLNVLITNNEVLRLLARCPHRIQRICCFPDIRL